LDRKDGEKRTGETVHSASVRTLDNWGFHILDRPETKTVRKTGGNRPWSTSLEKVYKVPRGWRKWGRMAL